jgi:hypothetical protein
MQSKATSVADYLASLPPDRREAIEAVRKVFLKNLDKEIEEGMQYGMIGYYVPHRVYPAGYHCDPKQPLPFAGIASQKNHMSLYIGCLYANSDVAEKFKQDWARTGKKLDMGKACVRFRKLDDLALDVIAEHIRRATVNQYVEFYEKGLKAPRSGPPQRKVKPKAKPRRRVATSTKRR